MLTGSDIAIGLEVVAVAIVSLGSIGREFGEALLDGRTRLRRGMTIGMVMIGRNDGRRDHEEQDQRGG